MNKFSILYADGSAVSGDAFKGDWKQLDDTKKIVKLEYILGNSCIVMEGFKQYNHFKELLGMGVKGYSKVILMGRTDHKSLLIIFDILKNNIYKMEKSYGEEYGKQILDGWQEGKLDNPRYAFKKLDDKKNVKEA